MIPPLGCDLLEGNGLCALFICLSTAPGTQETLIKVPQHAVGHPDPTRWATLLSRTPTVRRKPTGCVSKDKTLRHWARAPWKPSSLFSFSLEHLHSFLPGSCPTWLPPTHSTFSFPGRSLVSQSTLCSVLRGPVTVHPGSALYPSREVRHLMPSESAVPQALHLLSKFEHVLIRTRSNGIPHFVRSTLPTGAGAQTALKNADSRDEKRIPLPVLCQSSDYIKEEV